MKTFQMLADFLNIKKPVTIKMMPKSNRECEAEYMPNYSDSGRLIDHEIVIYTKNNSRDLDVLLAHELIHAWQEENKCWENHGKFFRKYARRISDEFGLDDIYIPDVDLE